MRADPLEERPRQGVIILQIRILRLTLGRLSFLASVSSKSGNDKNKSSKKWGWETFYW